MNKRKDDLKKEDNVLGCETAEEFYKKQRLDIIDKLERISENITATKHDVLEDKMVNTLDDVNLDTGEKAFLSLGPDFAIY